MDNETRKLLIEAENSIWVMQNNHQDDDMVKKFAHKLLYISLEIAKNLAIYNKDN